MLTLHLVVGNREATESTTIALVDVNRHLQDLTARSVPYIRKRFNLFQRFNRLIVCNR